VAPLLLISDKSFSPASSMKVTSLRSTNGSARPPILRPCSQHSRSSATHGPANCPHTVHRCSVSVCANEIRSISDRPSAHGSACGPPIDPARRNYAQAIERQTLFELLWG
jgi:hypothetical protein